MTICERCGRGLAEHGSVAPGLFRCADGVDTPWARFSAKPEHHADCYQNTGVPDDLPANICDCRVLRMLDADHPRDTPTDDAQGGRADG
jgi:hypothetical protein